MSLEWSENTLFKWRIHEGSEKIFKFNPIHAERWVHVPLNMEGFTVAWDNDLYGYPPGPDRFTKRKELPTES